MGGDQVLSRPGSFLIRLRMDVASPQSCLTEYRNMHRNDGRRGSGGADVVSVHGDVILFFVLDLSVSDPIHLIRVVSCCT